MPEPLSYRDKLRSLVQPPDVTVLLALAVAKVRLIALGGPGSGNFGHAGRPGEIGGSGSGGPASTDPRMKHPSSYYKPANPDGHDTQQKFKRTDGTYTEERQERHAAIVDEMHHLRANDTRSDTAATPVEHPVAVVMGGGAASGKSSILISGQVDVGDNYLLSNADEAKVRLPEYQEKIGGKEAAAHVHEESSDISKAITKKAADEQYNLVLDGTGNASMESLAGKVEVMRKGGMKVIAHYVTVDTDTAVQRAAERGERTGRYVPETEIRKAHVNVSKILPKAMEDGLFDEVTLWDTNGPKTEPPVKIATAVKGEKPVIHNQALWDRFTAKANESTKPKVD